MDVIIIGAGAAGLVASKELSHNGLSVTILEARPRIGGRIYHMPIDNWEGGAEFIHGNLPVTFSLLQEAQLSWYQTKGEFWQVTNGVWQQMEDFFEHSDGVIAKMRKLTSDISIADFLQQYFPGPDDEPVRVSLTAYVEGYYSGTTSRTSTLQFLEEWVTEDEEQYRPNQGYGALVQYLSEQATGNGAILHLNTVVKNIIWSAGQVEVSTAEGTAYKADRVIVTVPLGVLTSGSDSIAHISFSPHLPDKMNAAVSMGFGSVIKVLIDFTTPFWEEEDLKTKLGIGKKPIQMALSNELIPTWWTQYPNKQTLLTGWLSGPKANNLKNESDEDILGLAVTSLCNIFSLSEVYLRTLIHRFQILNWTDDPFTMGSYSYSTLQTKEARELLTQPEANTIYFAGEALYNGPEMGTVEAALTSGLDVSRTILSTLI